METTPSAQTESAGATEVPESLEQIAKEIPVEQQATQFTAVPQQQSAPFIPAPARAPYIPDPITDSEGYKRLVTEQLGQQSKLESVLGQLSSKLNQYEQREQQAKIDAEVNDTVSKVNSKLNLEPDLVEAALNVKYKKDPAFKYIWDNRHRNPMALDKALKVVGAELQSKYQVRQDPQIAENVRAAKSSQQSASQRTEQTTMIPKGTAEFERYWADLRAGRITG